MPKWSAGRATARHGNFGGLHMDLRDIFMLFQSDNWCNRVINKKCQNDEGAADQMFQKFRALSNRGRMAKRTAFSEREKCAMGG
jgi:hypothetical protein